VTPCSIALTLFLASTAAPVAADDAAVLSEAGLTQLARGDVAQARTTLERTLALDEAADAAVPPPGRVLRRVFTLNVLAALAHAQGEDEDAERLLRRALRAGEGLPPEGEAERAETLTGLAWLVGARGDLRAGLHFASQALQRYERVTGRRRVERVEALVALASLEAARGRIEDAESRLRMARRIADLEDAPASLRSITAVQFGALRLAQGRYAEAESLLEDALDLATQAMGADHPALVSTMQLLADCYQRRGRLDDALALSQRALRMADRAYGEGSAAAAPILAALEALREPAVADRYDRRSAQSHGERLK